MLKPYTSAICLVLLSSTGINLAKEAPASTVGFKKIQLFDKYITEGASIGDVNADGKPDVIAGPLWWQGPDFKQSFAYAPVKTYPIKGPGLSAYSNNFFTFPGLITKDKWTDILKVGLPSKPAHLAVNPGEKPHAADNQQHSCTHCKAQDHICNESPQYVNVLGKGKQLLSYSRNHITLAEPDSDPTKPWKVYNISHKDGGLQMYTHGLGAGDINGDQLPDILEKRGWWQQPKNWDKKTPWKFHPYAFAPQQGGAQMFAYDIDGDGDSDVVTALNAHSWGLAWYEQIKEGGKITFKKHTVMTDKPEGNPYGVCFSQLHAMACADIDGDGIKDIVTGKCFYAHNGKDPGAEQPAVLYWFRTVRGKDGAELVPYQIDDNSGVGRQITTGDLNGDGKIDIVVGNKKGVFAFIQTKVDPKTAVKKNAKPKVIFREGESLTISQKTGSVAPQNMHTFGVGQWSGNSHLWWTRGKINDQIELTFTVPTAGNYRLGVGLTKAKDYGIVQLSLDGKNIGQPIDLYNDGVIHTGTIPLGAPIHLKSGQHRLGVKITGANSKAIKSYMFAIDYLILHLGDEADLKAYRSTQVTPAKSVPKKKFKEGMGNTLDAKAKTMEEQLALFKLPEGFVIENVSHEKLGTIKPISLNFDDAGRLWTQTASEYPKDRDPAAFDKKGKDKILVFAQPHLRKPQRPHVFADGLVMPISVLPHDDGVHMILGSKVFKLQDTNNDGKADKRTLLMSGFGVKDSHTCLHRLTRGPGNWIYCSQGVHSTGTITAIDGKKTPFNQGMIGRYRPDGTGLETIGEGMNNIWAWSINREGRTYIHEANDLGYSQAAFERDATYPSFLATASRNSLQHPPTSKDLGLDGTGFCGIATSGTSPRDFPAPWQDYNFVANPITGEINTVSYTVDELGNHHFKREADLVTCDDPMFRPVNVSIGPDGCLYIIDWYNRTISHGTTTRNLAKHDTTSGRIWRVRHKSQKPFTPPNIEKAPDADLLKHLTSGNLWEMRAALHQIGKRQPISLLPEIKSILLASDTPDSIRIHALWALENLRHFDSNIWKNLIASPNQNVRHEALRSLSTLQPPLDELAPIFESLTEEKSYYVLNELIRFLRDTPQKLSPQHLTFARSFYTAPDQLPTQMVQGWKKQYHALGGSYEKRFLNQLIESIGNTKSNLPAPDEKKWSQFLAAHPKKPAAETKKLDVEITRLSKLIRSTLKGDAAKGKTHYTTRCAACHDSKLGGFAPPLGGGAHRDIKELLTAIIKPNDAVEGLFYSYRVIKKDGSTLEGFRSDLSHKDLTLTFMGGGKIKISLSDIKQAGYIRGKSVMLENMHAGLQDQEIADLISYLRIIK